MMTTVKFKLNSRYWPTKSSISQYYHWTTCKFNGHICYLV